MVETLIKGSLVFLQYPTINDVFDEQTYVHPFDQQWRICEVEVFIYITSITVNVLIT